MAARRAYAAEALGTFALVFAGAGAIMSGSMQGEPGHLGISLVFGLVVMVCVYVFGGISGAHINPAVTLALAVTGYFPARRVAAYILSQCVGAVAASVALRELLGTAASAGATRPTVGEWQTLVIEAVLTGFLMLAVMTVVTGSEAVQRAGGLIIGGAVALGALWAGPLTGASMNPARSLGPALASGELGSLWLYVTGPILGAVGGALLHEALHGRFHAGRLVPTLARLNRRGGLIVTSGPRP